MSIRAQLYRARRALPTGAAAAACAAWSLALCACSLERVGVAGDHIDAAPDFDDAGRDAEIAEAGTPSDAAPSDAYAPPDAHGAPDGGLAPPPLCPNDLVAAQMSMAEPTDVAAVIAAITRALPCP